MSELDELYDDRTIAALDRAAGEPPAPRAVPARRARVAGALLHASALALRDVLDTPADGDPVVELRPDSRDPSAEWVSFLYVPGAPRASRLIIRPWLAPSTDELAP